MKTLNAKIKEHSSKVKELGKEQDKFISQMNIIRTAEIEKEIHEIK